MNARRGEAVRSRVPPMDHGQDAHGPSHPAGFFKNLGTPPPSPCPSAPSASADAEPAWALRFPEPVPYGMSTCLQEAAHAARLQDRVPDLVLALEHPPVVTLGRRGRDHHLRLPPRALAERGIELYRASRGGDVTYHAPGQWVLYPILKLNRGSTGARGYLHALEEIALRTAADFGVRAFRRSGMNGAWTEQGKISAIGFHLRRWVSLHGMSFNVDLDLEGFHPIVPCGLVGEKVSSLREILGASCPSREAVRERLLAHFAAVLSREPQPILLGAQAPAAWKQIENEAWARSEERRLGNDFGKRVASRVGPAV